MNSPAGRNHGQFGTRWTLHLLRIFAVLLPLAALVGSGFAAWNSLEQAARARVERAADMLREHAMRAFEAQDLALTAIELRMRGQRWPDLVKDKSLYDFLARLDASNDPAGGLALVDPSGRVALSSARPFGSNPLDVSGRDYVAARPTGTPIGMKAFIGQVVRAGAAQSVIIPMVRPREDPDFPGLSDGGVVVTALSPEVFETFYDGILETSADTISLFRLDGAVLASVPRPVEAEGAALPRSAGEMLSALRRGPVPTLLGPSPLDMVPRLTAFRRLDHHDVGLAYGIPREALNRDWRRRMLGPLVGAVLAMLLLLAATVQTERALRTRAASAARSRAAERQATLGLLAGGLAHDFGNITQSVAAAAQLLQRHPDDVARVRKIADHLHGHALRSSALSRRLLNTTRRRDAGDIAASPIDVSDSLREVCELLDSTLRGGIRVRCIVPAGLRSAPGIDRAELETALINLAANARDAMPDGGEVHVSAERLRQPPPEQAPGLPPGPYLRISVSDHGNGMEPEVLARLGEPFFTTKPEGHGTGLGLAMVAAFLRGVGGALSAESAPGQGTTIHLLLPAG